jgi:hypothetical protein
MAQMWITPISTSSLSCGSVHIGSPGVPYVNDRKCGAYGISDDLSYKDAVKNEASARPPHSISFLVKESPTLTIPIRQDVEEEEVFYQYNGLVCHING